MMKTLFVFFSLLLAVTTSFAQTNIKAKTQAGAPGFKITLQTPSFKSGIAYLAYPRGKSLYIEDSTAINNQGIAIFQGKKILPGGIYSIVMPGQHVTNDFFIDKEQFINVKADTLDLSKTVVTGSKENLLFEQYQKFVATKGAIMQQERAAYNNATTKKDSLLHEGNYNNLNKELNDFRDNITKNQPNSMMAVLLKAMKEPPYPAKTPVTRQDSVENYNYYKTHYWDGITFMDERVIRTPFFQPKLERYYREVLSQAPDSIIMDADYKLLLARTSPEMYKYLLNWFTDEYLNPKYMGQDAVFVHLFEKYHSQGLSPWLNEKQMQTITKRAYMQMANLIGEKAANLDMLDTADKHISLYDLNADYTIVVFWDPTCGHCKEEIPRIDSIYRASWKEKGVRIFAVLSENEKTNWIKYIDEHKIGDWTNAYQTKEMEKADADAQRAGFRQLYDVTQTPTLYLLDKEKRIIGKKLTWKQLNDFLIVKWNNNKETPKK